jgi:hypothetical protein
MENISPKKYIQTRARSLPIYKCYVNSEWEEAGMANVMVLRQHVTGSTTGAVFLVDLKCLGIKDTFWMFNVPEEDFYERLPGFEERFEEIDYTLAHNIIFAGHDFAMDFDIAPHKDFAVTKFILEEDDDNIPLVDIAVGENGVPHLITYAANQHLDALAKLRKNAGEGNYHYTFAVGNPFEVGEDEEVEDEEVEDEEEEGEYEDDEFIPLVDPLNVQDVAMHELVDKQLTDLRTVREQLIIMAEVNIRILEPIFTLTEREENLLDKEWDYRNEHWLDYNREETNLVTEAIDKLMDNKVEGSYEMGIELDVDELSDFKKCVEEANDNVFLLALLNIIELSINVKEIAPMLIAKLENNRDHDIIKLSLALRELVTDSTGAYKTYGEQPSYENIFSGKPPGTFPEECLHIYYLMQVIRHSKSESIGMAIAYYRLLTDRFRMAIFEFSQFLFYPIILMTLGKHTELELRKKVKLDENGEIMGDHP